MKSSRWTRTQLRLLRPFLDSVSLKNLRKGQDLVGKVMAKTVGKSARVRTLQADGIPAAWIYPKDLRYDGTVLYLHGGGYCCGNLDYAAGVGAMLSTKLHCKVFAPAYRLAPEHPYPAAVEDAVTAYRHLLRCGYTADKIVLCGESAGGGLCYALCMKLREFGEAMPAGIIALSPWTDLTLTSPTYEDNLKKDPSLSRKTLTVFANAYAPDPETRQSPEISPVFANLLRLPKSLIFVGADELLLDDARKLHDRLLAYGVDSRLQVSQGMWHAYQLYGVKESRADFVLMEQFMEEVLAPRRKLRWMRLDNAAKIYPAARRKNWSNVFRVSIGLTEEILPEVLQSALEVTVRRFPSMAVRLRRGTFWYYLEEINHAPDVQKEQCHPLSHMPLDDIRRCALRVLYYEKRIAVECFHAVTDGNGAMVFLKTLAAEYLHQRYGVEIPATDGVLDCRQEEIDERELQDDFLSSAGPVKYPRSEPSAYRLTGTPQKDGYLTDTAGLYDVTEVAKKAKEYGVSVTAFLCAVMMQSILQLQKKKGVYPHKNRQIKVLLPVNLRPYFDSKSLRNFVLFITPAVDPRHGDYTLEELCKIVYHQMGLELSKKQMQARITTNVAVEQSMVLKLAPLFLKNLAMKIAYAVVGENKFCLTMSNLGRQTVPEQMKPYVERIDFMPGVQATIPNNCGVVSYGDKLYLHLIRSTVEPDLEAEFFACMRDAGLVATLESNTRMPKPKKKL